MKDEEASERASERGRARVELASVERCRASERVVVVVTTGAVDGRSVGGRTVVCEEVKNSQVVCWVGELAG